MTGKELIKLLKKKGWTLDRIKGSHHIMIKEDLTVVVPVHGNRETPKGTLESILKHTGLKK
jgi:predicted RNA binding protein YcfA (HicA-like mRNA interferase family)